MNISIYINKDHSFDNLANYLADNFKDFDFSNINNGKLLTINVYSENKFFLFDFSKVINLLQVFLPPEFSPSSVVFNNMSSPQILIDMTYENFCEVTDEKG